MTIKLSNPKGKKIKCSFCRELIFFTEDDVTTDDKGNRYIECESCCNKIKLKRL